MAAVVPIQGPVRERTGIRPARAPGTRGAASGSARHVVCGREPQRVSPAALHPLRHLRRHRRGPGIDLRVHGRFLTWADRLPGDWRLRFRPPFHATDGQAADAPARSAGVAGHLRQLPVGILKPPFSSRASSPDWSRRWSAALVGAPLMRLSGNYVAVATMGFLIIVHSIAVNWDEVTRGARGLSQIPTSTNPWVAYIWAAIAVYVSLRLRNSPYGRAMIASRENLIASRSVGINVLRSRLLAFVVSALPDGSRGSAAGSPDRNRRAEWFLLLDDVYRDHHGRPGWYGQHLRRGCGSYHHDHPA